MGLIPEIKGFGSEGVALLAVIMLIDRVVAPLVKNTVAWQRFMEKRNGGKKNNDEKVQTQKLKLVNPHPPPGQAEECIEHGKILEKIKTKLEMFMTNCEKEFIRVTDEIKDLRDKYNKRR
jgi:hypothetical protein